jgi:carboxymethylenebutenolidase
MKKTNTVVTAALLAAALMLSLGAIPTQAQSFMEDKFNNKDTWWDDGFWTEGALPAPASYPVTRTDITYPSGGTTMPAVVFRPQGTGKFPAVLFQHGRAGMMDEIVAHAKRVAARGFVVLAADIYGGRFIEPRPIPHDYALEDDVNAALDALLARADVSTSRACLYSHTRGGYYTLKVAVTKKRQEDAAACYVSYYPHMQDPNAPEADQVYRYAPEADQLKIPALVFIGDEEQYQRRRSIETAFLSMRDAGRDATLMIYPGVGRGFDFRPERIRTFADDLASKDALARAARFMRKHLEAFGK